MVLGSGMPLSRFEQKYEPALCTGTAVGTQLGEVDGWLAVLASSIHLNAHYFQKILMYK